MQLFIDTTEILDAEICQIVIHRIREDGFENLADIFEGLEYSGTQKLKIISDTLANIDEHNALQYLQCKTIKEIFLLNTEMFLKNIRVNGLLTEENKWKRKV